MPLKNRIKAILQRNSHTPPQQHHPIPNSSLQSPEHKDLATTNNTAQENVANTDHEARAGELTFEEDTQGGMGRHLGLASTTFLM